MRNPTPGGDQLKDPAQLEREAIQRGRVHEDTIMMRDALRKHFSMKDLQNLNLLDTCKLYCDLKNLERKE